MLIGMGQGGCEKSDKNFKMEHDDLLMLIPARGGSKGVPRKNIASLSGKPLIAWTIDAALSSHLDARLIVSTDDAEIAGVARLHGAEVPFLRPANLSQDDSPAIDVVLHTVTWLEEQQQYRPTYVMLLQPTSPLRMANDVVNAIELARLRQSEAVVSVSAVETHPYWMHSVAEDGLLADFISTGGNYGRRQVLPELYSLNGAIYIIRRDVLLTQKTLFPKQTYAYKMPAERSLDIDTPWDLHLAELILNDSKRDG